MKLTTEAILTHPLAFGLTSATPTQGAICRMRDGLPLGELASDPDVIEAFGGPEAIALLPADGVPPREVHVLAAIRCAKSMISAAGIIRPSQTVDVSRCSRGDIIRHPVLSLRLDNTRAVMGHLIANLQEKPLLRPLVAGDPDKLTFSCVPLRHPSGAVIEVVPIPLDRAGGAGTSFWFSGEEVDEEARMIGAADGVRNFDHVRDVSLGRLLEGGQFFGIGSPWAPFGPIYDLVQARFGKPTRDLVIVRGKGPAMNPAHWTPARCAELQRQNPVAYATDVEGQFADPESGLCPLIEVDLATRAEPMRLPFRHGAVYASAMDPATRANSWACVVLEVALDPEDGQPRYRVALARQSTGSQANPLSPSQELTIVRNEIAEYGLHEVASDQHAFDAHKDIASNIGLSVSQITITSASKLEMFERLRLAIAERRLELSPDPQLRADLLSVRKRVTANGFEIHLPRIGGRHADLAMALAMALDVAHRRALQGEAPPAPPLLVREDPFGGWVGDTHNGTGPHGPEAVFEEAIAAQSRAAVAELMSPANWPGGRAPKI